MLGARVRQVTAEQARDVLGLLDLVDPGSERVELARAGHTPLCSRFPGRAAAGRTSGAGIGVVLGESRDTPSGTPTRASTGTPRRRSVRG
ncbi:hypothetical protein GCM10010972_11360 [Cellulomonas carbonis]|nr:hypothetical protein GCM10010972_11360 [Cellulomonas carbonis]